MITDLMQLLGLDSVITDFVIASVALAAYLLGRRQNRSRR